MDEKVREALQLMHAARTDDDIERLRGLSLSRIIALRASRASAQPHAKFEIAPSKEAKPRE